MAKKNMKKKKKKKKSKKKSGNKGPEARFQQYKQVVGGIDQVFVSSKRPQNPYSYINKKTHKIEILPGMPYISTSRKDVFELKHQAAERTALQDNNKFVKANIGTVD